MRTRILVIAALALMACHGEDDKEVCDDGADNDGNGLVDCADSACPQGTACGGGQTCSAELTCGTLCTPVAEQCGDGEDNDCDGTADCADADCSGSVACLAPSESCAQPDSAGRAICVSASRARLPADGVSTSDIQATLKVNGSAAADSTCTFGVSGVSATLDGASTPVEKRTDAAGRASVVFAAGLNTGRSVVSVSCIPAGQTSSVNTSISVELFGMGSMRMVSAEYSVLGARGSAYQEHTIVTFQLLSEDGVPYPAGATVHFKHQSQGGSFIGNVPACVDNVCTASSKTDAEGMARVLLTSGRTFAVLTIEAESTAGGTTARGVAGGFPVVGAKPSGAHISLDCRPWNIPALTAHDCLYSHYRGKAQTVDCTVSLADRYGTVLGVPKLVALQSEAGNVGPAAFTPAFDVTKPVAEQTTLGRAVSFLSVFGHPLPRDVPPDPDEHFLELSGPEVACGVQSQTPLRRVNPRDGLVTVIAIAAGEEGFVDKNLDGEYTAGEPFIDLGEPFIDADDDGAWSPGEWYEDVNSSGSYTGPNGKWDANTHIWTQERVLYTGYPALDLSTQSPQRFSRFFDVNSFQMPFPSPLYAASPQIKGETFGHGIFLTDANLNPLSAFTTYAATAPLGYATVSMDGPYNTADSRGSFFRMLYCDALTGGTCYHGPADDACRPTAEGAGACYVRPEVSHFTYGNPGIVYVTCPLRNDPGTEAVTVTADVEGVKTSLVLGVTCLPLNVP